METVLKLSAAKTAFKKDVFSGRLKAIPFKA